MRTIVEWRHTQFLLVGAAMLVLCGCPEIAKPAEPALAIRLTGGQGWSYPLAEIEQVSFGSDTLQVVTTDRTDSYPLQSIVRIEFLWDIWTGIEDPEDAAEVLGVMHLFQNQPNPFSPETRIAFELPQEGRAELRIYAASGRLIRTLVKEERAAGPYSVCWDGRDEAGRTVASGVYFYTLVAPGVQESRKMILLR